MFESIDQITESLGGVGYISTREISTALYIARHLEKPILIEGPAGVGKTDLAQSTAKSTGLPLVRLQCYEGLDESKALYEWKYGKQLLYTQILKEKLHDILGDAGTVDQSFSKLHAFDDLFFSEDFLEPRALLRALRHDNGAVLLIDEIDKSDEEFEAFLLEILSEFQVTIPEIGTVKAKTAPLVMLTSNNTREISDALKRRCLHLHISFPEEAREREIVAARVPGINDALLKQLVGFVHELRDEELKKLPSISETVDWARVLMLMHADHLESDLIRDTLNVLLKFETDIQTVENKIDGMRRKAEGRPPVG